MMSNLVGIVSISIYLCIILIDIKCNILYGNFNESFSNYPYFFISSIFGIPAFIWVCSKITRFNSPILFIGSNSLLYYYLQSVVLRSAIAVFSRLGFSMNNIFAKLLITSAICLIIWPVVLLINKYLPIMSGKYRLKLSRRL